jgi:hypothetical protein
MNNVDLFPAEFDAFSAIDSFKKFCTHLDKLELDSKVSAINLMREILHEISPFKTEPVDFVKWVKNPLVHANDYNPNSVAPPEMELLRVSIDADGYTQPIVSMPSFDGRYEVIDGFHRHRVGKECADIQSRVHGYLPLVQIRNSQYDKSNRMASTIRHNRARGKHKVDAMSDIVIELKRRNWSDEKIAKNLGMDADEVLRLCQITGLAEAFKDQDFSEAWEVDRGDTVIGESITDILADFEANDKGRTYHTFDKWECFKAGFYAERCPNNMTQEEGEAEYTEFLADLDRFRDALEHVVNEWTFSCEHYLTNERMNRIAWLGQAAVAYAMGIPSMCRGGYHKLSDEAKKAADALALEYLNKWLEKTGRTIVDYDQAGGRTEAELY